MSGFSVRFSIKLQSQLAKLHNSIMSNLFVFSLMTLLIRDQMVTLFKEVPESLNKFSTQLIALIALAATNSDTGKSPFMEQNKLVMMSLVLTIVLYYFLVITGTICQIYNRSLLPIITCAMLLLGSAASVLALSIISPTVAWISLALWVAIFTLLAYDYAVPRRIKDWIEGRIARSSELPLHL